MNMEIEADKDDQGNAKQSFHINWLTLLASGAEPLSDATTVLPELTIVYGSEAQADRGG